MQISDLANEWSLLQNQFDSYEKYSLLIKLSSIALLSIALILNSINIFIGLLLLILWLQDAIWKTFQSRIETRLLSLEKYFSNEQSLEKMNGNAYQFNSDYQKNRPGMMLLINEYCLQAIKPTVAYPYILLLLITAYKLLF